MTEFVFISHGQEDTQRLGRLLAEAVPPGTTIALSGTLGAGKTHLVQAIARGCGVPEGVVTSPTFVLCQEYHGRRMLYHFDAYRLRDEDEFLALGVDEYFQSDGIVLIEWADRVERCLPAQRIDIHIEVTGETDRTFTINARGAKYAPLLASLARS